MLKKDNILNSYKDTEEMIMNYQVFLLVVN